MISLLWTATGLMIGVWHARWMWRESRRLSPWLPLVGLMRLLVVGAFLVLAAFNGGVLPAAAGWFLGMLVSVIRFELSQGKLD